MPSDIAVAGSLLSSAAVSLDDVALSISIQNSNLGWVTKAAEVVLPP